MRIKEIAAVRPSWGSPRIHVLLRREGWLVNHKRTERLHRLEGLNLRRNRPRRRKAVVTRGPSIAATRKDERWSMDFMHDQLQDGRRLRVLTVVGQYTREALATEARGSFSAHDVIDVLNRLSSSHRKPAVIQVDNGTEFASRALDAWAHREDVRLDFSRPGKADGQRAHRVVQCPAARGVPERPRLRIARRRRGNLNFVAERIQCGVSTQRPGHSGP
jgi:putative transposase